MAQIYLIMIRLKNATPEYNFRDMAYVEGQWNWKMYYSLGLSIIAWITRHKELFVVGYLKLYMAPAHSSHYFTERLVELIGVYFFVLVK